MSAITCVTSRNGASVVLGISATWVTRSFRATNGRSTQFANASRRSARQPRTCLSSVRRSRRAIPRCGALTLPASASRMAIARSIPDPLGDGHKIPSRAGRGRTEGAHRKLVRWTASGRADLRKPARTECRRRDRPAGRLRRRRPSRGGAPWGRSGRNRRRGSLGPPARHSPRPRRPGGHRGS